jgi:multidrug resistance efflux pump
VIDIVERLRALAREYHQHRPHYEEAADEIERLQELLWQEAGNRVETERLRAALQRLITDYEDVPDPTDADGQAVFEDARRALEPKP